VIISRIIRGGGARVTYRERRDVYTVLLEKLQGKRRLGGPSRRWEDNIKLPLQGKGWALWTG